MKRSGRLLTGLTILGLIGFGGLLLIEQDSPRPGPAVILQSVPTYPNAQHMILTPTLALQSALDSQYNAAAELTFDTTDNAGQVVAFYDAWHLQNNWLSMGSGLGTIPATSRSYEKEDSGFHGIKLTPDGGPIFNGPWFMIVNDLVPTYRMSVYTSPRSATGTGVEITLYQLR